MEDVAGYGVPVLSLKYGEVELFTFAPASHKTSLTAVMDSGSSCFILPDTDVNGTFTESPYARWQRAAATVRVQHARFRKPVIATVSCRHSLLQYASMDGQTWGAPPLPPRD